MPHILFSRSSSKLPRSPPFPEHVSSSSPPQEKRLSPPLDDASLSGADGINSPLPTWSSPSKVSTPELGLPEKKSAWKSIHKVMSRNHSSTQVSTGAGSGSQERPFTPSTATDNETELWVSPSSSATADPSTTQSYEPEPKKIFRLPSYSHGGKPNEPSHKIEAIEGELIASRHNIGTASVDCEFYKIEYGLFKERPACMIVVDVRLVYPPDNTIDSVKLEFQFAKDEVQKLSSEHHGFAQSTKAPISKIFAPEMIEGLPNSSQKTTHHDIKPMVQGLSFKLGTGGGGGQTTITKTHRWRVQGRREENNGIYNTFGWNIFQNEISEDSIPRQLRLGMIAFHQHEPFCVDVNIEGSTRQKHWRPKATHDRRWFNPPNTEDVGRHILHEAMVENLVSKQNLLIRDIAQSRAMEGKTVNLIDLGEISGGAGSGIDGGGMITDLLSAGEGGLIAGSPTTSMDSMIC